MSAEPTGRRTVPRVCEVCGARFYTRPNDVKNGEGRFCSRRCASSDPNRPRRGLPGEQNPSWKGGISQEHYPYKLRQKERYPDRVKARELVARAIARGDLVRQPCGVCGSTAHVHAHHHDYSHPLDVEWLCRFCHRKRHGGKH